MIDLFDERDLKRIDDHHMKKKAHYREKPSLLYARAVRMAPPRLSEQEVNVQAEGA